MYKFCFYPHPSSANHGCEAIAISTYHILKKYLPLSRCTLLTKYPKGSERRGGELAYSLFENELNFPMPSINRYSLKWMKNLLFRIMGRDKTVSILSEEIKRRDDIICANDVFVSIGGDNYCYGRPASFYAMNRTVRENGKKSMLWGCSVEPSAITDEMLSDLRRYNMIVVRESLTYNALKEHGLTNIRLYPDPAFTLEPVSGVKIKENTVGINMSPMILDYADEKGKTVTDAYRQLIKYILRETDFNVALIPHVTANTTDDRTVLKLLNDEFKNDARITLYDDMDCQRIKHLISQCRFFIGARTHATIAAYSSCVPTLVCGYSVKAKGIATDLFGTYDNYVVPVQKIDDEKALVSSFKWIAENEEQIRHRLVQIMPEYIQRAWQAGEEFVNVVSE